MINSVNIPSTQADSKYTPDVELKKLRDGFAEDLAALHLAYIEAVAEYIAGWVLSNYEDPAESVPYCSEEGGYMWPLSDVREIIEEDFFTDFPDGEIPEEIVEAAVERIGMDECFPIGDFDEPDPDDLPECGGWRSTCKDWPNETKIIERGQVPHPRFGRINTYPHGVLVLAWDEVFSAGA